MPAIKRNLIKECGLHEYVQRAIDAGMRAPKEIADELNRQDKLQPLLMGKTVLADDVSKYLTQTHSEDSGAYDRALQNSPSAQSLISTAATTMKDIVKQAGISTRIAEMLYSDVEDLHRRWLMEREAAGSLDDIPEPAHLKHLNVWLKNLRVMLEVANTIKTDERIQQVLRAQTLNVRNGMTQDEFFDALFGVCRILGVERADAISAFAEYQQSKGKVIDAALVDK